MTEATEWPTTGSASISIDASPEQAYAFVTDLEKLPTLSPENQRCEFTEDSTAIEVGATFRGWNKNGDYEWHADCAVVSAEPGREFSFKVPPEWDLGTIWKYEFEAEGDGVRVTESFDSPMLGDPEQYPGKLEGRCENLRAACQTTLENLKVALES